MKTKLLIVGAGPYGIAVAAFARKMGLDFLIVGKPMGFWKSSMPEEMLLRSGTDWHLDASNELTLERFVNEGNLPGGFKVPISKKDFLAYANWFIDQNNLNIIDQKVTRLMLTEDGKYRATLQNSDVAIEADNVVVAIGFEYYQNIPAGIISGISSKYYGHSCDVVKFDFLKDKKCLILGGRQAAFEWSALSFEKGCKEVVLVFDHDLPKFEHSDWSWIDPLIKSSLETAGWFSALATEERERIQNEFWKEGRLKLEPWLKERLTGKNLKIYPNDAIDRIEEKQSGPGLNVYTAGGREFAVDYLILATGYKIDLGKIPFLRDGNLGGRIETQKDFPVLNARFESNIPGLYFTSFASMASFGPFCGFIKGAPLSAKIIVEGIIDA